MEIFIYSNIKKDINDMPFEVVETKGKGHPDNICDTLAERISASYSKHCLDNYGMVLRHMVDKITLLGGGSKVSFGNAMMINPIRVLINGRFTTKFENDPIDYWTIIETEVKDYIKVF